ncbi:LacI family DNA-binding transcriptional regulator [Opitutus terrae]|uniref:Transcriptional regulator, LacI family n=1 Tax=Opitutus terrae (strain DSM 11246 / JCM 15787 / PB90-1) TaxID=452637 RepID=B1ZXT8_OPITP|nr:LacI family DNA-binding transcriptional regulator [Opitutus terrae]ACB74306.1 transcriptional regulator, LacI family [Opitutus terrae PB90-1]
MLSVAQSGKVTLQDVAAKAGVSISTASRSLTGAVGISKATQERVLSIAQALGYRYNPLLGEVMRSTRRGTPNHYLGTLAYITPYDDVKEWRATPTLCRHWSAACDQAALFGFSVSEFALTSHGMTARRLGEILKARGITGILLAAFPKEPFELVLPWEHFATVPVGHMVQNPQLDCVVSDHTQAVLLAGRVLAARGYQRIGLAIESYQNSITNHGWANGYAALPVENPELAAIPPFLPPKITARAFLQWVRQNRVDCVLTLSTFRNEPNPMREWLAEAGLICPRDIGLVSLDVTPATSTWAGIDQNSDEIGKAAVDLVVSKIRAGERGVPRVRRSLLVHCQWRDGDSVRSGRAARPNAVVERALA